MEGIPDDVWKCWQRKRRHTLIGFLFVSFIMGMDLSSIFITMYLYLKELVPNDLPNVYYGIILGCYNICSMVSCVLIGRWLDKTRKVRLYSHLALCVQIIGYLLYMIPLSPMFLLFGRLSNGLSGTFVIVVSGEVFRIYDEQEGIRVNFWLTAFGFLGVLVGPGLSAVFKGFEIHIGRITINYLNIPAVVLAGLAVIALIVVNALVHDCSAQIDLKDYLKKRGEGVLVMKEVNEFETNRDINPKLDEIYPDTNPKFETNLEDLCYLNCSDDQCIPVMKVLKCFATDMEAKIIFFATFIIMFSVYSACIILPLIMQVDLKWDISVISIIIVAYGISGLLLITLLGRFLNSSRSIFGTSVFSIICQACASCTIVLLYTEHAHNIYADVTILSFELNFLIIGWFFADTLLRVTLAKMVPSRIQSFSECLRAGMLRCAIITASFIAPNVLPWLLWWAAGALIMIIVLLIMYILRRKQFLEPKELCFGGYTLMVSTPKHDESVVSKFY